jgi:hypothetical protein
MKTVNKSLRNADIPAETKKHIEKLEDQLNSSRIINGALRADMAALDDEVEELKYEIRCLKRGSIGPAVPRTPAEFRKYKALVGAADDGEEGRNTPAGMVQIDGNWVKIPAQPTQSMEPSPITLGRAGGMTLAAELRATCESVADDDDDEDMGVTDHLQELGLHDENNGVPLGDGVSDGQQENGQPDHVAPSAEPSVNSHDFSQYSGVVQGGVVYPNPQQQQRYPPLPAPQPILIHTGANVPGYLTRPGGAPAGYGGYYTQPIQQGPFLNGVSGPLRTQTMHQGPFFQANSQPRTQSMQQGPYPQFNPLARFQPTQITSQANGLPIQPRPFLLNPHNPHRGAPTNQRSYTPQGANSGGPPQIRHVKSHGALPLTNPSKGLPPNPNLLAHRLQQVQQQQAQHDAAEQAIHARRDAEVQALAARDAAARAEVLARRERFAALVARLPESDAQSAGLGPGQGGRWSSDPVPVTADAPLIEAFRLLGCDETCSITYVRACAGQMAVVGSSLGSSPV